MRVVLLISCWDFGKWVSDLPLPIQSGQPFYDYSWSLLKTDEDIDAFVRRDSVWRDE